MFSCTSDRNPCWGPKIAASVTPAAAATRSVMWTNPWSTDAGLQTTPTRLPDKSGESSRRSEPREIRMADDYFMLIEPLPGYTPTIGRLVGMLTYVRQGLVKGISGLSGEDLDHLHDAKANSIGALLAHAAAVERWYQILTFEIAVRPTRKKRRGPPV
jgi:hypothetical protein